MKYSQPLTCEQPNATLSAQLYTWLTNATLSSRCADKDLVTYLLDNGITMHSCDNVKISLQRRALCKNDGSVHFGALTSELVGRHESIGATNILDIVHHVYGGESSRIFDVHENVFKILLAGEIKPQNVYLLLLQLHQLESLHKFTPDGYTTTAKEQRVQVFILADDESTVLAITKCFELCSDFLPPNLHFVSSRLLSTMSPFDFIDYHGSISVRSKYAEELRTLISVLSPNGVIGITGFSENFIVNKIRSLLSRINIDAHPPFSKDFSKFVVDYLNRQGYTNTDYELVTYITTVVFSKWFKSWTVSELIDLVHSLDLKEVSFLPLLARNPYGASSAACLLQLAEI